MVPVNSAPADFDAARDLPEGFLDFLAPLHAALTLRQRALVARRDYALAEAHAGKLPDYLPPSVATTNSWRIELPALSFRRSGHLIPLVRAPCRKLTAPPQIPGAMSFRTAPRTSGIR